MPSCHKVLKCKNIKVRELCFLASEYERTSIAAYTTSISHESLTPQVWYIGTRQLVFVFRCLNISF